MKKKEMFVVYLKVLGERVGKVGLMIKLPKRKMPVSEESAIPSLGNLTRRLKSSCVVWGKVAYIRIQDKGYSSSSIDGEGSETQ